VFDLKERIAVVTGGNGGIGLGMGRGLARAGAHVVVAARNAEKSANAVREIERVGGHASAESVDVADEASVRRLMDAVRTRHGRLDILINNAGMNIRKPVHELALTEWRQVIDTNLTSAYLCCHAA
jgi:2-dehydro-3-deoxy-D-gluconate 5-dehydrogenase